MLCLDVRHLLLRNSVEVASVAQHCKACHTIFAIASQPPPPSFFHTSPPPSPAPLQQLLLHIAEEVAGDPLNAPASPIKRMLSVRRLLERLAVRGDVREQDRQYGLRGVPLLSLEELLCLVHLLAERPQLALRVSSRSMAAYSRV